MDKAVIRGIHVVLPLLRVRGGVEADSVDIQVEVRLVDDTGNPITLQKAGEAINQALNEAIQDQCSKWGIDPPASVGKKGKIESVLATEGTDRQLRHGTLPVNTGRKR